MLKFLVKDDWSLEFHNSFTIADHKDKRFRVIGTGGENNNKAQFAQDLIKNLDSGNTKSITRNKLKELQPYVLD